jgi:hypothetical protein
MVVAPPVAVPPVMVSISLVNQAVLLGVVVYFLLRQCTATIASRSNPPEPLLPGSQ